MQARMHKVLLIDDDEDSFVIARDLLSQVNGASIQLEWASTFEDGLEAMLRAEHAAYLVDFRLGAQDGLELMRTARASGCRAPIIFVTGQGDHAIDLKAMEEGAADYLVKGQVSGAAIERSLRYAIERYRAEDQRLKNEAQLRIFAEQMPAILWTTDCQLRFTSNWGAGLLGLQTQPNQWVGKSLFDYFETDDPDHEAIVPHRRALLGESVSFDIDWHGRNYRAKVNPLRDDGGQIIGTVGTALDVTYENQVEDEFRAARRIQEQMLPKAVPVIAGYDLAAVCHPAAATGGDYFDFIPMPCGSLGIVIADVSRHGFASALIMAASKRVLRTLAERGVPFDEALTICNSAIAEDTNSEYFVTLFFAKLDPMTRRLTYAGAGHEAYLIDPSNKMTTLESINMPLGVHDAPIEANGQSIQLEPGQVLLLFTDGYNEARSPERKMFGIARVLEAVQAHRSETAAEIVAALDTAVREYCYPALPHDDLTIVVLKVNEDT